MTISSAVVVILWLFIGYAAVPLLQIAYNTTLLPAASAVTCATPSVPCARSATNHVMQTSVTPVVYVAALVAFVGWFLFVVFVGIGLASFPMDLIREYFARPQSIDLQVCPRHDFLTPNPDSNP